MGSLKRKQETAQVQGVNFVCEMAVLPSPSSATTSTMPSLDGYDQEREDTTTVPNEDRTSLMRESTKEATDVVIMRLPWLLYQLYVLNGLTLAMFMLPMMYIVNTRVQVPVAYLSTYGSVAFLPYSFHPIYAYLSSSPLVQIPRRWRRGSDVAGGDGGRDSFLVDWRLPPRHWVLLTLLVMNSVCLFVYASVPPGGIILIFVAAFFKGMFDAWSELCLGLTLMDTGKSRAAEAAASSANLTTTSSIVQHDHSNTIPHPTTPTATATYDKIVSRFQAQAATARNVGSMIGGTITFLVFLQRYLKIDGDPVEQQLSGAVANGLLILTGILNGMGAIVAFLYRDALKPNQSESLSPTTATFSVLQQTDAENQDGYNDNMHGNGSSILLERGVICLNVENEADRLITDDDRSGRSNSGREMGESLVVDDDLMAARNIHEKSHPDPMPVNSRASLAIIVILQLIVVMLVLKDPFSEWTNIVTWKVSLVTLCLAFVVAAVALWCNSSWQFCHRVGLFLILRNAIPSDAMVVASFTYTLFQSQPILLQSLSVLSLTTLMASSWTYEKLWARFSRGRSLIVLIGVLTILSGLASLLNIAVFWKYEAAISDDSDSIIKDVLGIAVLATIITTFFSEWAFLPEVVLASVSVGTDEQDDSGTTAFNTTAPPNTAGQTPQESRHASTDAHSAVKYGSLIACIEFGDQLGSLTAAPIVATLGISRENNFEKMDMFLLICYLSTMIGTLAILPLLQPKR
jgi:hypothetical protein